MKKKISYLYTFIIYYILSHDGVQWSAIDMFIANNINGSLFFASVIEVHLRVLTEIDFFLMT